jgi:hypothetical protein
MTAINLLPANSLSKSDPNLSWRRPNHTPIHQQLDMDNKLYHHCSAANQIPAYCKLPTGKYHWLD